MEVNVEQTIIDIVKNVINDENIVITEDVNLINDVGMDSISLIMFIVKVEEKFQIILPDEIFTTECLSNLSSIISVIKDMLAKKENI